MSEAEQLVALFRRFDDGGTGIITRAEITEIFQQLDPTGWPDKRLAALLAVFDTKGDGNIRYDVLSTYIMDGVDPALFTATDEELAATIQAGLAKGPSSLLAMPLLASCNENGRAAKDADERSFLEAAISSESLAEVSPPSPPAGEATLWEEGITEQDLASTIQRSRSDGPATLDARIPNDVYTEDGAELEAHVLNDGLCSDPPTEPPTRRPSLEDVPEEEDEF
eukprot:TRINITY_DN35245_c0_g1_i1.p3 TRINITY_DN35245_c0_g1~~TRINITY_DN35245_c0_g1_i1.p3  ORF type:complete len:224 (+),score=63.11 TRINITY_DN35245_c0_g1_i1:238-909(+)